MSAPRKLLVIGWDAADWKIINPLIDAGLMPTLARFVEQGCIGNIATLRPCLSPMLWTSIATGKRADRHGVCGFVEPLPDASGVKLVGSTTRKTKAFWNITSQSGLKTHVIGWYASHPAEPINGVCVSDQFLDPAAADADLAPEGAIHPAGLREHLSQYRVRPGEIGAGDLIPFIPRLAETAPNDPRPARLASALSACASIHAVATDVLANQPWDVAAVYYDAIDRVGHDFMPFHPPRMPHVGEADFALYNSVIVGMYRFHDMMLDTLLQIAGEDTTVVLLSDHGFHSDHLRPAVPAETHEAQAALWHRHLGVLAMRGPGIKPDERVYGATLLDVTPTLLAMLGLPVGRDMEGRPLAAAFDPPLRAEVIESWDTVPGASGQHPPDMRVDAAASAAAVQQLIDLGYLTPQSDDATAAAERAARELQFNLAQVHMHARRFDQADQIMEQLCARAPDEPRYVISRAYSLCQSRRMPEAATLLKALPPAVIQTPDVQVMLAQCELAGGEDDVALERLLKVGQMPGTSPSAHIALGNIYRTRGDTAAAEAAFRRALAIDEENEQAHYGLAVTMLTQHKWEPAAEHALRAVGLLHGFAQAHYVLGVALDELGEPDRGLMSLNHAVTLAPNFPEAHNRIAAMLTRKGDVHTAMRHKRMASGDFSQAGL